MKTNRPTVNKLTEALTLLKKGRRNLAVAMIESVIETLNEELLRE